MREDIDDIIPSFNVKVISKSEIVTKQKVIHSEVPLKLFSIIHITFEKILTTGVNCETALFMFIIKTYKSNSFRYDLSFRENFKNYCRLYDIRDFKEISIKKGMSKLYDNEIIDKSSKGIYRLNTTYIVQSSNVNS